MLVPEVDVADTIEYGYTVRLELRGDLYVPLHSPAVSHNLGPPYHALPLQPDDPLYGLVYVGGHAGVASLYHRDASLV